MEGGGEHLSPGMPFVACTGEQALAQPAPEKVIVTSLNICFLLCNLNPKKEYEILHEHYCDLLSFLSRFYSYKKVTLVVRIYNQCTCVDISQRHSVIIS